MGNNRYVIDFNAETKKAERDIVKLTSKLSDLEKISKKVSEGFMDGSEKNIANTSKKFQDIIAETTRLNGEIKRLQAEAKKIGNMSVATKLTSDLAKVNMASKNASNSFQSAMDGLLASRKQMDQASKSIDEYREKLQGATDDTVDLKVAQQSLNTILRKTTSTMGKIQRGTAISGTDAHNYTQGRKYYESLKESSSSFLGKQSKYEGQMSDIQARRRELLADQSMNATERNKRMRMLDEEQKVTNERIKVIKDLNKKMQEAERIYSTVDSGGGGFDYTGIGNAPSSLPGGRGGSNKASLVLSLLAGGASAFKYGSNFIGEGRDLNRSMAPLVTDVGLATGNYDDRAIRSRARNSGAGLGYGGADSLSFTQAVTSGGMAGTYSYKQSTAEDMMRLSRGINVQSDTYKGAMTNFMRQGGVQSRANVNDLTKAISGAVKQSGMQGREEEMVKSLQGMAEGRFSGRTSSAGDLKDLIALQTVLAGTGSKALQGEQGAQAISTLDSKFKSGGQGDPFFQLMFGKGTKYRGPGGVAQMYRDMEKGATTENLSTVLGNLDKSVMNKDMKTLLVKDSFGLSMEQTDKIMEAYNKGSLSDSYLKKLGVEGNKIGDKSLEEGKDFYDGSTMGQEDKIKANRDKKRGEMDDSKLGDVSRRFRKFGSEQSTLGTFLLGSLGAGVVGGGGVNLLMKSLRNTGGAGIKDALSGFGGKIKTGFGEGMASIRKVGAHEAPKGDWMRNTVNAVEETAGKTGSFIKGSFKRGKHANPTMFGNMAEDLSKGRLPKGLTKGLGILGLGVSALNIATSKDKVKTTGKELGGWGGALGGAKLGAMAGTAIAPGLGTAVGSIIGGVAGGFGGSKLGGSAVDGVRNLFDGSKKSEEKSKADKKESAERKRGDNIKKDSENLAKYDALLTRADRLASSGGSSAGFTEDALNRAPSKKSKKPKGTKMASASEGGSRSINTQATINLQLTGKENNKDVKRISDSIVKELKKGTDSAMKQFSVEWGRA